LPSLSKQETYRGVRNGSSWKSTMLSPETTLTLPALDLMVS
jgi:hypothetical protein